jgi:hypothetical protein
MALMGLIVGLAPFRINFFIAKRAATCSNPVDPANARNYD